MASKADLSAACVPPAALRLAELCAGCTAAQSLFWLQCIRSSCCSAQAAPTGSLGALAAPGESGGDGEMRKAAKQRWPRLFQSSSAPTRSMAATSEDESSTRARLAAAEDVSGTSPKPYATECSCRAMHRRIALRLRAAVSRRCVPPGNNMTASKCAEHKIFSSSSTAPPLGARKWHEAYGYMDQMSSPEGVTRGRRRLPQQNGVTTDEAPA